MSIKNPFKSSPLTLLAILLPLVAVLAGIVSTALIGLPSGYIISPGILILVWGVLGTGAISIPLSVLALKKKEPIALATLIVLVPSIMIFASIGKSHFGSMRVQKETKIHDAMYQRLNEDPKLIYQLELSKLQPPQRRAFGLYFRRQQDRFSSKDLLRLYETHLPDRFAVLSHPACPEEIIRREIDRQIEICSRAKGCSGLPTIAGHPNTPRDILERIAKLNFGNGAPDIARQRLQELGVSTQQDR